VTDHPSGFFSTSALPSKELEEGEVCPPRFHADGLIPAITGHDERGEIVMFAGMNADALSNTSDSGEAW